jgi:hypothetical protein
VLGANIINCTIEAGCSLVASMLKQQMQSSQTCPWNSNPKVSIKAGICGPVLDMMLKRTSKLIAQQQGCLFENARCCCQQNYKAL